MSSTTSGPSPRPAANDDTSWATEARRLAQDDLGVAPWIAGLTQKVAQASDDDLGTFIVARAVLTKAAAERAAELARQRSEQAARLAREGEQAAAAERERRGVEAQARSAQRQSKLKRGARVGVGVVVLGGVVFYALALIDADRGDSVPAVGEMPVVAWSPSGGGWREDGRFQGEVPPDLTDVVQLAAGTDHFVALRSDGTVTTWRHNDYWNEDEKPGIDVPAELTGVAQVAAWEHVSVAVKTDGTLIAWGEGSADVPSDLTNVAQVSDGIALHTDGTVSVWGPGDDDDRLALPDGVTNVVQVEGNGRDYFALRQDGSIVAWEYYWPNGLPEADVEPPEELPRGAVQIAVNTGAAIALRHDGTVEAWGTAPSAYNERVELPDDFTGFVQVDAGPGFLGLKADGTVMVSGNQRVPRGLSRVVQVVGGDEVAVALRK